MTPADEVKAARFFGKRFRVWTTGTICKSWRARSGQFRCVVKYWNGTSAPWDVRADVHVRRCGTIWLFEPGCRRELHPTFAAAEAACRRFALQVAKAVEVE